MLSSSSFLPTSPISPSQPPFLALLATPLTNCGNSPRLSLVPTQPASEISTLTLMLLTVISTQMTCLSLLHMLAGHLYLTWGRLQNPMLPNTQPSWDLILSGWYWDHARMYQETWPPGGWEEILESSTWQNPSQHLLSHYWPWAHLMNKLFLTLKNRLVKGRGKTYNRSCLSWERDSLILGTFRVTGSVSWGGNLST